MANSRFRCSTCKQYGEQGAVFRQVGLSRFCSTGCFSTWLDAQRTKGQAKAKKAASLETRVKKRAAPRIPGDVRYAVRERDGGLCRYCAKNGNHCHHVRYRSEGGPDTVDNLVLLCGRCHELVHSSKRAFQPVLLEYLQVEAGQHVFIPDVARRLEQLGLLSELQRERFGLVRRSA